MELIIHDNYEEMSAAAAHLIINSIKSKPNSILCFASGDTPKLAYQLAGEAAIKKNIDVSKSFFIGLDEWLGIPPGNNGSCHYFLHHYLFNSMNLASSQFHLFDAMTTDEESECKKMNHIIDSKGGIDLMVVGVGMNGHIGFNEPGTGIQSNAHVARLDEVTKIVGKKYFNNEVAINKGITVGLKQVMQAKTLLMIANGKKKAPVMRQAVEGPVGIDFPASLIRNHSNGILIIDREAASELKTK